MTENLSPKIWCIILNWNGCKLLGETLDSVQKMTYPDFEIIVVDNGSEDGSREMVATDYPGVILLENETNLGFGEGNNVGLKYALEHGADWIFLLNNDIAVAPELLSELMKVAHGGPKIGALGPTIYYFDDNDTLWFAGGQVNFWTGQIAHRGIRKKDIGQYPSVENVDYLTGCALLLRAEALRLVGLFDPIYSPAYTEDVDLCQRIRRAGYDLRYVPAGKVWHKVSSSTGGAINPKKTQLKIEHNLIFFKRYAGWYHWPGIVFCTGFLAIFYISRQIVKADFKIVFSVIRGFGKALIRLFQKG